MKLDPFDEILADIKAGKPVVLIDDVDREDEGDLTIAAESVTPEILSFMMTQGKGLICLSLEEKRLEALSIPRQVSDNKSFFGTNFTLSVDHSSVGAFGITAEGRTKTILRMIAEDTDPGELISPGWVFPLAAKPGGVFQRRGQTEGSVDLARLAGMGPAGVICEIMDEAGKMLRGKELVEYCKKHKLKLTSVEEIRQQRMSRETLLRRVAEAEINNLSDSGLFSLENNFPVPSLRGKLAEPLKVLVYQDDVDDREQLVLVKGDPKDGCLVRVHSECLTGDIFDSSRCDCGEQLSLALAKIFEEGAGVVVYLQQEGRGIGLGNKIKAYALQDKGRDTVDANLELGFAADERSYGAAAGILTDLGLKNIRLMTNNPDKVSALEQGGLEVSQRVDLPCRVTEHNRSYLETKRKRMGHILAEKL